MTQSLTLLLAIHYSIFAVIWHSAFAFHHKLTKRELISTFGIDKHHAVPDYEVIRPVPTHNDNGDLEQLTFTAWNRSFVVELTKNSRLISNSVEMVVRDSSGIVSQRQGLPPHLRVDCHYVGSVAGSDDVKAAISFCERLRGVIVMDDHFLMLQTLPDRIKNETEGGEHVIYKREAGLLNPLEHYSFSEDDKAVNDNSLDGFCDVNESTHVFNYTVPSEAKLDSLFIFPQHDPITLEIGLFLDSKLYEHFEREFSQDAEQHLTEFALALINNVHVLYQQPSLSPNLDVVIVRFEMWKQQPPPLETALHKNGQAQTLLDSFCRYQARINPGSDLSDAGHWDHGVLLTGYDIYHTTTSVAGVAPVARMCDEIFACSLVEGLHLGRSFVLAHEMGHNMGMVHDGVQNQCPRGCCLMSAVNGAGKTTWSTCSVREFNSFLLQLDESGRGNCLRDPAESITSHDHLADGRLPGQRYTADQQCSYFWGRDYQVEIPAGRQMSDICRILWCGNSGSTISTAHPALEGSFCGTGHWCQEGRCQPWHQPSALPPIVHGGWSEWASTQKACPISPCQVTGSINLKSQLRTCTLPAPNNGGNHCSGANIRGIVCGEATSSCSGLSRQEFGNRLCTAIKNDQNRPDRQLSGLSFMHHTQPCKIWCHVADSELIRNKGQYPNGSPCGVNQFCVAGSCLTLSCDSKAVVAEDTDCPAHANSKKSVDKWDPWSEWSPCSVSCATPDVKPLQRRNRQCLSPTSSCPGDKQETRICSPAPQKCAQTGEWSTWSECSRSCGGGVSSRRRDCLSGKCSEALEETQPCNGIPCPEWTSWGLWTTCSSSCGPGQRSRTRSCPGAVCDGEANQIEVCFDRPCVADESWGEWQPCSVSCGIGFQLRERLCNGALCGENSKQARTCNVQDCNKPSLAGAARHLWGQWTSWSPCSTTCGEGFQTRERKCLTDDNCPVVEPKNQERRCVLGPCPAWSAWGAWSAECVGCSPLDFRTRHRSCRSPADDSDSTVCPGNAMQFENCDAICRNEAVRRSPPTEDNNNGLQPILITPNTGNQADWGPWQEWLPCSVTCGGGIRERVRFCPEGKDCHHRGLSFELEECSLDSCQSIKTHQWTEWTEWSSCSVACGGGRQVRQRKCRAFFVFLCDGPSHEEKPCNVEQCVHEVGISEAAVVSRNSDYAPEWSTWSLWSACSCLTSTQSRRRFCKILDPAVQGFCTGSIVDQRSCHPESCTPEAGGWSAWSEWSQCSKDCGSPGHRIRNRMCSDPLPSNRGSYCVGYSFDQQTCEAASGTCVGTPVNGGWSEWTTWSTCSNPCSNGQRSRTRFCSSPRPSNGGLQCTGSDFELKACMDSELCGKSTNGSWTEWGPWSPCSAPCGLSFKHRTRFCSNPAPEGAGAPCSGLPITTSLCTTAPCPNAIDGRWGPWSTWSPCTSDCHGTGTRTRTRPCVPPLNGGHTCYGKATDSAPCQPEPVMDDGFCSTILRHAQALETVFSSFSMTRSIR